MLEGKIREGFVPFRLFRDGKKKLKIYLAVPSLLLVILTVNQLSLSMCNLLANPGL